jgi:antitoxin component of MazEF toxin-antitoxin module
MGLSSKSSKAKKVSKKKPARKYKGRTGTQYKAVSQPNEKSPGATYKLSAVSGQVKDPGVAYTSKIRAIGNSKGVILNNQLIQTAGLTPDQDIVIHASDGVITIMQIKETAINTDLSSWDAQFKDAIKGGAKPEGDIFAGIENEFDSKEW